MNDYFALGFEKLADEIPSSSPEYKGAKGRRLATILGSIPIVSTLGIGPGLAAKEGRGLRTGAASLGGKILGAVGGGLLGGAVSKHPAGAIGGTLLGGSLGGGLGAYLGHGADVPVEKKASMNKEAIGPLKVPEKLKEAYKYLTSGRSIRNMIARHKISKIPLVGGSELLKSVGGGLAQHKVKNMDLRTIGKNIQRAGTEVGMLAKNRPGRLAAELAIGGGLLHASKKINDANKEAKEKKKLDQMYSQPM